jgi:hypothetical protein
LYGFETWYLIFREEHILTAFKNRVMMRIFGPKSKEGKRRLEKLHK